MDAETPALTMPQPAMPAAEPRAARLRRARRVPVGAVAGGVGLVTFLVFLPALWNSWVAWDDNVNFLENPHFRGLSWPHLRWMATTVLMGQWIPLTWLTLGLDYVAWGMNPLGYHLTSVLLHAANVGLFSLVAFRLLTRAMPGTDVGARQVGAAAAALFFGLHPLRVESVAWITERRDVLSGLFFLLTLLAYLRAVEGEGRARRGWLALSVGAFLLAVTSKSIVVMLPVVLLVLDVYPLGRLDWRPTRWTAATRPILLEKVPYFLLSLGAGLMAIYAIRAAAFLTSFETLPLASRLPVALFALWFYLSRTLVPAWLAPLYELPAQINALDARFVLAGAGVVTITAAVVLLRRRCPAALAAWVVYLAMLAPVSGLAHNGYQLAHDRYSYLPCLGLAVLFGGGLVAILRARSVGTLRPRFARLAAAGAVFWLVGFVPLTWHQIGVWRDSETLWRYALDSQPDCSVCHANLGVYLGNLGFMPPALEHLRAALALRPDRAQARYNLGLMLVKAGYPAEAIGHLRSVLARHPDFHDTRNTLAVALIRTGQPQEAAAEVRTILRHDADNARAHANLGSALIELGKPAEALHHLERAMTLKPDVAEPRLELIRAHLALGDHEAARGQHEALRRLDPKLADWVAANLPLTP